MATSCPTGPRADLSTVCQPCRGHIFSLPGSHSQGSEPTPVAAAFFAAPGCWAGSCLQDCGRPGPRRHSPESSDSTGMSVPLRSLSVDSGRKRGDGVGCETLASFFLLPNSVVAYCYPWHIFVYLKYIFIGLQINM